MGFKNHFLLLIILISITIACVPSIDEPVDSSVVVPDIDATLDASMDAFMEGVTKLEMPGNGSCLLYTSPSPRDLSTARMPSSA